MDHNEIQYTASRMKMPPYVLHMTFHCIRIFESALLKSASTVTNHPQIISLPTMCQGCEGYWGIIREFANYKHKRKHKHKRKISIQNQCSMTCFERNFTFVFMFPFMFVICKLPVMSFSTLEIKHMLGNGLKSLGNGT